MPNLKDLDVQWVSLVDRAAVRNAENPDQPQRFLVWKRDATTEGDPMPTATEELAAALEKAELPDSVREAITKASERESALATATEDLKKAKTDAETLTARVAELEKAAKPAPTDDDDADDEAMAKADPAIRRRLEKAAEESKAMADRVEKAEQQAQESDRVAKAEREERLTRDFIAKAQTFEALPFKAAEFGPVLKSCSEKLSKEEYAEVERVLTAADEQIAKGELFKEQGAGGDGAPTDGLEDLTRKAEELRKNDPSLSQYEAMNRARVADRAAQERYLAGVR